MLPGRQTALHSWCRQSQWDAPTVARFLGTFLSEPKPSVFFAPPHSPLPRVGFARRVATHGIVLDRRTFLYDDDPLYVNGEVVAWPADGHDALARLANDRALHGVACAALSTPTLSLLHEWYRHGFLTPAP